MEILILGGTVFLGRHIVDAAQSRGHQVTLFNRGKHNPDLFPDIEKLLGDRDGDLDVLKGRKWDAVVDTCGYVPRIVRMSAEFLAESADLYVFISTLSVYADLSIKNLDETSEVGKLEDETTEEITGQTYGPLKALCERAAEEAVPGRVLNIRPGLIVGPHDPTDRFTYWPVRMANGGQVLAPEPKDQGIMYIDVRDLARWTVRMIEGKKTGVFNADGPDYELNMEKFLEECIKVSGSDAELTWADANFLLQRGVQPWMGLPLWLPGKEAAGMSSFNISKAIDTGLSFRPLTETIADTLGWSRSRPQDYKLRAGISADRERELLEEWSRLQDT